MPPIAPGLPTKFPCWCKAVYSFSGETDRDLGFVEGDFIECLNAGDGSWWMGRLRRDKRVTGLFPSNFVEILPENNQPASRSPSPLPIQSPAGSLNKPQPQKSKSVFRKPFQAYAKAEQPNPEAAARRVQPRNSGGSSPSSTPPGSFNKHRPYSAMKRPSNESSGVAPSPLSNSVNQHRSRSPTRLVHKGSRSRAPSPAPSVQANKCYRAVSPAPPVQSHKYHRAVSPAPPTPNHNYHRAVSPAPPPASSHSYYRAPSPAPPVQQPDYSRAPSPAPSQYQAYNRGPSPAPSQYQPYSRGPSPAPQHHQSYSRGPSPASYNSFDNRQDSPPPPPPPHRILNGASRAPSPMPYNDVDRVNGYHTPEPPSPRPGNLTPSPLTNAMNDVMSSLEGMGMSTESPSRDSPKKAPSIWSPEAFDEIHNQRPQKSRAQTSQGFGATQRDDDGGVYRDNGHDGYQPEGHVDGYVQRMESRLRKMQAEASRSDTSHSHYSSDRPPPPPPKSSSQNRPLSSLERGDSTTSSIHRGLSRRLRSRKSAYELGKEVLGRTFTTKSSVTTTSTAQSVSTQQSNSTQMTGQSIASAGGFSATSAGSFARRKWALGGASRPMSVMETRRGATFNDGRPETPFTGITYHSSHASQPLEPNAGQNEWQSSIEGSGEILGGLTTPKHRKSGFFKRMVESAKTGAASARSTIAAGSSSRPVSRQSKIMSGLQGRSSAAPSPMPSNPARDMGLGGSSDWVQVRRDVNRSNSLSKNERMERAERCQMMDIPVLSPIEILLEHTEGDESLDGLPVSEPADIAAINFSMVDKSARFINSLPPMTNSASLAQGTVCRPYRSDVQRLRAIFTWVSERISWEEDFEGHIDSRKVIHSKRGCAEEVAVLVMEMCSAVGLHAEVVRGYLKIPGQEVDANAAVRPNHWWNAVIVDGEWRIMDCSLASPTNPKRAFFSSASSQVAESWWFLARPLEICYTHVPSVLEQQHMCPPMDHQVLMALPCACPPYFKNGLQLFDFDTSLTCLENLELAHIHFYVPPDVECVAEVEANSFSQDGDGDFFENGNKVRKRALAQAEWVGGQKRYTVKALLPGDEGHGVLKVYAGKRGLMHSIKSNPHSLAFALILTHTGQNPAFDFLTLHPTPHAQRHDLYVAQPQCARLALNNTFVFQVRQHPSSLGGVAFDGNGVLGSQSRAPSPAPFARPTSAMSMTSASTSQYSHPSNSSGSSNGLPGQQKPAKLAIQSPGGKIIRLVRKSEHTVSAHEGGEGGVWETVIKIGERGTWRGLVLADRSARWCVFAEWESM